MKQAFVVPLRALLLLLSVCLALAGSARQAQATAPAAPAPSPPVYGLSFVSSIGGEISTLAVDGALAYVGEGYTLAILDVSDPTHPQQIADVLLPEPAGAIRVQNGFAYVVLGDTGLRIFDVHDPHSPRWCADYWAPGAIGLQLAGNVAYLKIAGSGILILDITSPTNPVARALAPVSGILGGNRAYVTVDRELRIVDISDPEHPAPLGSYQFGFSFVIAGVHFVGGVAYVNGIGATGAEGCGVSIVDMRDPAHPALQNWAFPTRCLDDLHVAGSHAYATDGDLQILDVSVPTKPKLLSSYPMAASFNLNEGKSDLANDLFYQANPNGLVVVDVADALHPRPRANYRLPSALADFKIAGGRAYAAGDGLELIDLRDPIRPAVEGYFATTGTALSVDVAGDRTYVGDSDRYPEYLGGLRILDVSQPLSPTLLGTFATPGNPTVDAQVIGGIAYVVGTKRFEIADVSNPAAPVLRSSVPISPPTTAAGVQVVGNWAYVAANSLRVFDVGNPLAPQLRATYSLTGWDTPRIRVVGNTAYLANQDGGLVILDVADPAHPASLGFYGSTDWVKDVQVVDNLAYLALGSGGVQIVDVSDPKQPKLLTSYATPWYVDRLQVVGDLVYISSSVSSGGLWVLRRVELAPRAFVPLARA